MEYIERDWRTLVPFFYRNSTNKSEYEECTIHFQDGDDYQYRVPIMRVQQYSPKLIGEKHLHMLIPFLPIRFREAIKGKSAEKRREAQKDLTELLTECIIILNHEKENGILTEGERNDISEFLACACEHLYGGDAEVIGEVHKIMEPVVWLRREMEQRNKELEKDIQDLQKGYADLQKSNTDLQKSNTDLQKSNTDLQKSNTDLQKSNTDLQKSNVNLQNSNTSLQKNNRDLQKDKQDLQEKMENGLKNLIHKLQEEGKNRDQVLSSLEELFSLSTAEAEEKVEHYWNV